MKILRIFFVVLTLLVVGLHTLQAQDTIRIDETIEGELSSGEAALYQFEAKAGDRFIITLRSEDFDAYLYLRDASGSDLISNDDSGGTTDSQLLGWEAPADGIYTIVADGFHDTAAGTFSLSLEAFTPVEAVIDEPAQGTFDAGTRDVYFAFEGRAGQIVDIVVDSGNSLDTKMELISPYGYVMSSNDDATGTIDPALTNILLDTEGTYFIHILPQKENATLNGDIRLVVSEASLPSLDDGPIELEFGDNPEYFVSFEGTAGETVRLNVESNPLTSWSTHYVRLQQNDDEFASFNFSGSTQATVEFTVPGDGQVTIIVQKYADATVTLTLGRGLE